MNNNFKLNFYGYAISRKRNNKYFLRYEEARNIKILLLIKNIQSSFKEDKITTC